MLVGWLIGGGEKRKRPVYESLFLRSLPDLNRSSRFCRPVPSPSAKRPFLLSKAVAKVRSFSQLAKYFFVFCCEVLCLWVLMF